MEHLWVCVLDSFLHVLPFPAAGAILPLSQMRIRFPPTLFYLLATLKTWQSGVRISELRSDQNNITGHAQWVRADLEHNRSTFWMQVSLFPDCMSFHPSIVSGCWRSSTCLAPTLFNFISVPNFGASPPGCPGQSRGHTLLPKRPRMPATEFIDGDWTRRSREGLGLEGVKGKADPVQLWQPQRWRLEERASWKRWEQRAVRGKDGDCLGELLSLPQALSVLLGIAFSSRIPATVQVPNASYLWNY